MMYVSLSEGDKIMKFEQLLFFVKLHQFTRNDKDVRFLTLLHVASSDDAMTLLTMCDV